MESPSPLLWSMKFTIRVMKHKAPRPLRERGWGEGDFRRKPDKNHIEKAIFVRPIRAVTTLTPA
jgi:hypothetical protein